MPERYPKSLHVKQRGETLMIRGISFEIPNERGRYLGDILKPIAVEGYNWWVGGEEAYLINGNELENYLFPGLIECMEGETLKDIIENNEYYLIFQDLKAFPKSEYPIEIKTFEDFTISKCELTLLLIDSCYIAIYCKDDKKRNELYVNAKKQGYFNLKYITEQNDFRTRLTVW